MALLAAVDASFVWFCSTKVLDLGPSVYILFGFEVRTADMGYSSPMYAVPD
jgi:hypothetical protein